MLRSSVTRGFSAALLTLAAVGVAGCMQNTGPYSWGDRTYASYEECIAAKRASQQRATVAGAVGGAATGAIVGGNVGEAALAAGVGAAAGALIAGSKRC